MSTYVQRIMKAPNQDSSDLSSRLPVLPLTVDNGEVVVMLMLGLSAAFHTCEHEQEILLIYKAILS